jgi:hypothetical protein
MGNLPSMNKRLCLSQLPIDDMKQLVNTKYTIIHPSTRKEQDGWRIQLTPHSQKRRDGKYFCESGDNDGFATTLIEGSDGKTGLRIFMNNGQCISTPDGFTKHSCSWRPCFPGRREIWPTHLTTQDQREKWWEWLDSIFSPLKCPFEVEEEEKAAQDELKVKRKVGTSIKESSILSVSHTPLDPNIVDAATEAAEFVIREELHKKELSN